MPKYAQINSSNIVVAIVNTYNEINHDDFIPAVNSTKVGMTWNGTDFLPAPVPTLAVALDKYNCAVNEIVNATFSAVLDADPLDVTGNYYVPLIGVDGRQQQLAVDKIRPRVSSALTENVELIVHE
jgi:hypothetical protein